jgi:hypothetical protein
MGAKQYGRIWTIKTINPMDKFIENQASNHAFHCASVWHNSKRDNDAKRYFDSEKKVTLCPIPTGRNSLKNSMRYWITTLSRKTL